MGLLKSIGNIANAMSTANDLASTASGLIQTVKGQKNESDESNADVVTSAVPEITFSKKIDRLIELILTDGELNEEEKDMLIKVAENEGFDPDEVLFVVKKQLKLSKKSIGQVNVANPKDKLSPAK